MLAPAFVPSVGLASSDTYAAIDKLLSGDRLIATRARVYSVQAAATAAGRAATLAPKDPTETVAIAVDFSAVCSVIDHVSVACEQLDGPVDLVPTDMLLSDPVIRGTRVAQLVRAGVGGASYRVRFTVDSGPLRFVETALIRVSTQT